MSENWLNDLVDNSPIKRHIAWIGELGFSGATEDDRTGRTVTFLLRRPVEELHKAHPFSPHTRRRRNRAGTLFTMSLAAFDGETPATKDGLFSVMLLNWSSGPKGDTVKFLLNFEDERHPFLGCTRAARDQKSTRWMATFVEEDDASQAVDQKQRASVEAALAPKKQQIRNSNLAAQFIKDPKFHAFALDMYGDPVDSAETADQWMKRLLMVTSKAEFDRGGDPAQRFEKLRDEFVQWQLDNYGPEETNR